MITLNDKFKALKADNAPGQEIRQNNGNDIATIMKGSKLEGISVDFSHGDVNAFPPTPGSKKAWENGFIKGGEQAYTEYRGDADIRSNLAKDIAAFTGNPIDANNELIITPGTQGALFLAIGATVTNGTKVAVIEPDYFANRKLVKFFDGEVVPITLHYQGAASENDIDLKELENAFKNNTKVLVFSTPNNPTGLVYSKKAITAIGILAEKYDVTVIVDQLYSRMLYSEETYTHLRACEIKPNN